MCRGTPDYRLQMLLFNINRSGNEGRTGPQCHRSGVEGMIDHPLRTRFGYLA